MRGREEKPIQYGMQLTERSEERPKQLRARECQLVESPPLEVASLPALTWKQERIDLHQEGPYLYGYQMT